MLGTSDSELLKCECGNVGIKNMVHNTLKSHAFFLGSKDFWFQKGKKKNKKKKKERYFSLPLKNCPKIETNKKEKHNMRI